MRRRQQHFGFSVPELLVVIGIILMVIAIAMPAVSQARRRSVAIKCQAQLHQIGAAVAAYAANNRGRIPLQFQWSRLWQDYLFGEPAPAVIVCPTGADIPEKWTYMMNGWLMYFRASLAEKFRNRSSNEVVLFGENKPGFHYPFSQGPDSYDPVRHGALLRSNYLWLDLHVSNDDPKHFPGEPDAWYARPVRW